MTGAKRRSPAKTAARASVVASQRTGSLSSNQVQEGGPHIVPDRIWVVLARRAYEEPLREVGTVEADDRELACVYARSIYDEFAWIEMVVVPRDALITVIAS